MHDFLLYLGDVGQRLTFYGGKGLTYHLQESTYSTTVDSVCGVNREKALRLSAVSCISS